MAVTKDQTQAEKPAETEGTKPANIPAATEFDPSGAPRQIVPDVDVDNPAVDNNPRAGTTGDQNKIDFNDPTKAGHDAVADALNAQGVPTKSGQEAAASVKAGK